MVTGAVTDPAAQATIFGWTIVGPVRAKGACIQPIPTHFTRSQTAEDDSSTLTSKTLDAGEPEGAVDSFSPVEEQAQASSADNTSHCSSSCRSQETLPCKDDVQDYQDLEPVEFFPLSELTPD